MIQGAGVELAAARARSHASNLDSYIDSMCVTAGLATRLGGTTKCPSALKREEFQELLQTGFGEISLGCRGYVQLVFEERLRDSKFRNASTSVQSVVSGILTLEGAGSKLFSYLILGSGAANAFYDISRLDPLKGMSTENILRIVNRRQSAFEAAATRQTISSRSQLIRLWQEYQWICSPLSISSDFNTLAVATLEDRRVDFTKEAAKQVSLITQTQERIRQLDPNKGIVGPKKNTPDPNALGTSERSLGPDIGNLQAALCRKPTGRIDNLTRQTINTWRVTADPSLTAAQLNEGLTEKEVSQLLGNGSCTSLGYKTEFERAYFYDAPALAKRESFSKVEGERTARFENLMKIIGVANEGRDSNRLTPGIRKKIEEKRKELGLAPGDFVDEHLLKHAPQ
ncbi:hypothetical protein [Rhizobium sp. 22-785-1]